MMSSQKLRSEKQLIEALVRPLFAKGGVEVDIGDDAAVLELPSGHSLVVTVDGIPERLIARRAGIMSSRQLGRYLAIANLSDLAAMGAEPVALLLGLRLTSQFAQDELAELLLGVDEASFEYACPVVGGDTTGGSVTSLSAVALGAVPRGKALRRDQAKAGEGIFVTGTPGLFGLGLAYLLVARENGLRLPENAETEILQKLIHPHARVKEAGILRELGSIGGCQDVSDGIGQTVREICLASKCGFVINMQALTEVAPSAAYAIAETSNASMDRILLGPGADFELVFTAPKKEEDAIASALASIGTQLTLIGEVRPSGEALIIDGHEVPMPNSLGWEHFKGPDDDIAIKNVYSSNS